MLRNKCIGTLTICKEACSLITFVIHNQKLLNIFFTSERIMELQKYFFLYIKQQSKFRLK